MNRIKLSCNSADLLKVSSKISSDVKSRTEFSRNPAAFIKGEGIHLERNYSIRPLKINETTEVCTVVWACIAVAAYATYAGVYFTAVAAMMAVVSAGVYFTVAAYGSNLNTDPSFHNGAGAIGGQLV